MARNTTPRGGTRRTSTTTKKPAVKRAPKAAASETGGTDGEATAAAPVKATRKSAAAKIAPASPVTKGTAEAPKAPAKAKTPTRAKSKTTATGVSAGKAPAKPRSRAAAKPATVTRTDKARNAVTGAAAAVAAKLPDVKVPQVKLPEVKLPELPEVTPKRAAIGAGLLAGIGAAVFLWRNSRADQPDYKVVEQDGDFEIREYPAMTTAATSSRGPRRDAMDRNFRTLADYIFAKSRPGEKLAMTVPVTTGGSATDGWTTRFVMPSDKAKSDLPAAPQEVSLETHPPRRAAAVRFGGTWTDALLETKEGALRSWLQLKGYPHDAKAEHAAYNSPMMPGPLRRNELLITLSEG